MRVCPFPVAQTCYNNRVDAIRAAYIRFFKERGHALLPSAPIKPLNDPTTLFTGSGMQPLVPYLLGTPHPAGDRLVDSQKCFRAEDIEEVGDNRHTTFFEMLGNWSLGSYFKQEQLPWFFEFLTQEVGLDPKRLYVTVFDGDQSIGIPRDEESIVIWKSLFAQAGVDNAFVPLGSEKQGYEKGMQGGRIFSYEAKKNWWSRAGVPQNMPEGEPGGPDSEVFYDFGTPHDPAWGQECHPNCDCGRFMEIGNSVFMEYIKRGGAFEKLAQQNVDFGGGLERIAAAKNNDSDVFKTGPLRRIVETLERMSGKEYDNPGYRSAFRIIADHLRGAVFMIGDGLLPGNVEQGYFVRRLIRRSVRYADILGIQPGTLHALSEVVVEAYEHAYPELRGACATIDTALCEEEDRFRSTLERGLKELEKMLEQKTISGHDAFVLFTTYGFPVELTREIAHERGVSVDFEAYAVEMVQHREQSRAGAEKRFKGGLADSSAQTTRLHTAHHLLLRALQEVLGAHVKQRGSNITGERLRIDFSHPEKMTDEQKKRVEMIVNEKIQAGLPIIRTEMQKTHAEKLGAEMEFGQKYPDTVTVYSVGPKDATFSNPQFERAFSLEFCGGPHVENTAELAESGVFKILKEEASSAGVRRIKAVLE